MSMFQLSSQVKLLTESINVFYNDRALLDRVFAVLNWKTVEKPKIKILGDEIYASDLTSKYNKEQHCILNHITFTISSKEHIAIVGCSGSGKSTLAKIIIGLLSPNGGKIYIDGIDINEIASESINKKINIVMQEPFFFNRTIRENLLLAKRSATNEEIKEACQRAYIYDFIDSLPEKINTIIGERGIKISGGQRQRLAIARTILLDPDIFVFDESTSSLDYKSENQILESIRKLAKEKTIITNAHRLSSVIDAKRIIVIDKGRIVAIGNHEELHGKQEIYDALFGNQYHSGTKKYVR